MYDIHKVEMAIIILAEKVESGEWQGVAKEIRDILGYEIKPKKHEN